MQYPHRKVTARTFLCYRQRAAPLWSSAYIPRLTSIGLVLYCEPHGTLLKLGCFSVGHFSDGISARISDRTETKESVKRLGPVRSASQEACDRAVRGDHRIGQAAPSVAVVSPPPPPPPRSDRAPVKAFRRPGADPGLPRRQLTDSFPKNHHPLWAALTVGACEG